MTSGRGTGRLRIVVLADNVWDGGWCRWHEVTANLAARGHEVYLAERPALGGNQAALAAADPRPVPDGVHIVRFAGTAPPGLRVLYSNIISSRQVRALRPDVVIGYQPRQSLGPALMCALSRRAKFVLDYIDAIAEFSDNPLKRAIVGRVSVPLLARLSSHCICTAEMLARDLRPYNRAVSVVPNGVDLGKFEAASAGGHTAASGDRVAFVGAFGEWVDFAAVADAARRLPQVTFDLYGDGATFDTVRGMAQGTPNLIVHGRIPHVEVAAAIRGALACLIPFKVNRLTDRVFPNKLVEYWAMRKPVICSPFAELRLVAGDKLLFAADGEELANQIQRLRDDPALAARLADDGYREAIERYDSTKLAARYEAILERVVASGGRR